MTHFKDHKVAVSELLGFIPEALLSHLSTSTNMDHYSKFFMVEKYFICFCTLFLIMKDLVNAHWKIPLTIQVLRLFSIWMNPKLSEGALFLRDCQKLTPTISRKFSNACMIVSLRVTISRKEISII